MFRRSVAGISALACVWLGLGVLGISPVDSAQAAPVTTSVVDGLSYTLNANSIPIRTSASDPGFQMTINDTHGISSNPNGYSLAGLPTGTTATVNGVTLPSTPSLSGTPVFTITSSQASQTITINPPIGWSGNISGMTLARLVLSGNNLISDFDNGTFDYLGTTYPQLPASASFYQWVQGTGTYDPGAPYTAYYALRPFDGEYTIRPTAYYPTSISYGNFSYEGDEWRDIRSINNAWGGSSPCNGGYSSYPNFESTLASAQANSGKILVVNVADNVPAPNVILSTQVGVSPDTTYSASLFYASINDVTKYVLEPDLIPVNLSYYAVLADGTEIQLGQSGTLTSTVSCSNSRQDWKEFARSFNTGNNSTVTLQVRNNIVGGNGNDLAIDNITLQGFSTVSMPVTVTAGQYKLSVTKSVTSAATQVKPNDTVTYRMTVTNTGDLDYTAANPAAARDDLSKVLDDATYNNDASVSPSVGTVSMVGSTLTWSGPLEKGQQVTITYSVKINALADQRDHTLTNMAFLSPTPPAQCASGDTTCSSTTTLLPAISLVKTSSTTTVTQVGQQIPYSLTATNTGAEPLQNVTISDPKMPTLSCQPAAPATLAVGGTLTCTGTYQATITDLTASSVTNTATASGRDANGAQVSAQASKSIPVAQTGSIAVTKTANPTTVAKAGDKVTYTVTATNNGNVALTNVAVNDSKLGGPMTCGPWPGGTSGVLQPNASVPCTGTYTVAQADVDAGGFDNTATATGRTPDGTTVNAQAKASVGSTAPPGNLTLAKKASTQTVTATGQNVTYTFTVANNGGLTVSNVAVADPLLANTTISCVWPDTSRPRVLAPNAQATCTGTYKVTLADMNAKQILNTATATGTDAAGKSLEARASATVDATWNPLLSVVKSSPTTLIDHVGQQVTYGFTVTNTGNVTLNNVTLKDPMFGTGTVPGCGPWSIDPGKAASCSITHEVTQGEFDTGGMLTNTVTATAQDPNGGAVGPVTSTKTIPVGPGAPGLQVTKSADTTMITAVGQSVTYTFTVRNAGTVTLSNVSLTDSKLGTLPATCGPWTTMAPNDTKTCQATYTSTQADLNAGRVLNVATATGSSPGKTRDVTGSAQVIVPTDNTASINVVKTANTKQLTGAGQKVTFTVTVTNTGKVTLNNVTLADSLTNATPATGADCGPWATLAPQDSKTCTLGYTVTLADMDAGNVFNLATATGTKPGGGQVADTDDVTIDNAPNLGGITIVKSSNSVVSAAGNPVTYTFTVTNTGMVTLHDVNVTDPMTANGLTLGTCHFDQLTPGPTNAKTCTGTYTASQADVNAGQIVNTATATGTTPDGSKVTGSDTKKITVGSTAGIEVTKTAPSSSMTLAPGDWITYQIKVTNTGTVTLTDVRVTDSLPGVAGCSFGTLLPGAANAKTCTADYQVTQPDINRGSVTNTAVATGTTPDGKTVTDDSTAPVNLVSASSLSLIKAVTSGTVTGADQTIAYLFTVTNTGTTTLKNVQIAEQLKDATTSGCSWATLTPGEIVTCTGSYKTTQADANTGQVRNVAIVSGEDPNGDPVQATGQVVTTIDPKPALSVAKTEQATNAAGENILRVTAVGDRVVYTFKATNTGNVTLSTIGITDTFTAGGTGTLSAIACDKTTLDPQQAANCTATYTVVQADLETGVISNTAVATGKDPGGNTVTSDNDRVDIPVGQTGEIGLDKSANPSTVSVPGPVTYTLTVTNNSNVTLKNVTITDPMPDLVLNAADCSFATLLPGAANAKTCTATYQVTQADIDKGSVSNTATATGQMPDGSKVTGTDTETVTANPAPPSISLVKATTVTAVTRAGASIPYTFTVTNTGGVTLSNVTVNDPMLGGVLAGCGPWTLAPYPAAGSTRTCAATYQVTQADMDAGTIHNLATATGNPPAGEPVKATSEKTVGATPNGLLGIDKTASTTPSPVDHVGQQITYGFTVTNKGNVTLHEITLDDPMFGGPVPGCGPWALAPGLSASCSVTHEVTQGEFDANTTLHNEATVTGLLPDGSEATPDTDTADVPVGDGAPSLDVTKTADTTAVANVDQTVTYKFVVRNTGSVTLTNVTLNDQKLGGVIAGCGAATLAPGAEKTCAATYTVTQDDIDAGKVPNTAIATGTYEGQTVTGQDQVTLPADDTAGLTVKKTADTTRLTHVGQQIGYSFMVSNTGKVTLKNVTLTDSLSPDIALTDCGPWGVLNPGASVTCTGVYTATQADLDAGQVVNGVHVTGDKPDGDEIPGDDEVTTPDAPNLGAIKLVKSSSSPLNAAGDEVAYTFTVINTGQLTLHDVTVTDPMTNNGLTLSGCSFDELKPGQDNAQTCTGTYKATQADINTGYVLNTATASGLTPDGTKVTGDDTKKILVNSDAGIEIVKTALPGEPPTKAGQRIGYQITVTNTGTVTLTDARVSDVLPGVVGCTITTLLPGASNAKTCTLWYTVTQDDINAGSVTNKATVTADTPDGGTVTDDDTVMVDTDDNPSLRVVKSTTVTSVDHAGQVIPYTFVVTNNGTTTMKNVTLSDDVLPGPVKLDAACGPWPVLEPGDYRTCTGTYTVTLADMNAGQIVNVATVKGEDPNGDEPEYPSDPVPTGVDQHPSLAMVKTADVSQVFAVGDQVVYTFAVANTGNVTIDDLAIDDVFNVGDMARLAPTPIPCDPTSVDPGGKATCTATYTVAQADLDNGVISNTAIVTGEDPKGDPVDSSDKPSTVDVPVLVTGGITVDKSADKTVVTQAGEDVVYTFVVANTGNVTLKNVTVSDSIPDVVLSGCSWDSLASGAQVTCYGTYRVTQADIDHGGVHNVATAKGTRPGGDEVTGEGDDDIDAQATPAISLAKTASVADVNKAGQPVTYTFEVKNTGKLTLSGVTINDPRLGGDVAGCGPWTLAPNATTTCTATYQVTQPDIDSGAIHNVATASGNPPQGEPVTATDDADVNVSQNGLLTIDKTTDTTLVDHVGQLVTYGFLVTNAGNVTLDNVVVNDPMFAGDVPGCGPWSLTPGQQVSCAATHQVSQADLDGKYLSNTATVTGKDPGGDDATPGEDTVDVPTNPEQGALDVTKTASTSQVTAVGQTVTYKFTVRNSGPVALTDVSLAEELADVTLSGCGPWANLAVGATAICTGTYQVTQADLDAGQIVNHATATGTQPDGGKVTGEDSVTVLTDDSGALRVVKTADTSQLTHVGQQVTYTFTVSNTGKVTLADVTLDESLDGVTLSDCGPWESMAPGDTVRCTGTYEVTQADIDTGFVHNAVTVTGHKPGGGDVTGTDDETVPNVPNLSALKLAKASDSHPAAAGDVVDYTLTVTNTGQTTLNDVTVTDPMVGLTLDGCSWDSIGPGQTQQCTGTYAVTDADVAAGEVLNTAVAQGTAGDGTKVGDEDSARVVVGEGAGVELTKTVTSTGPITAAGQTVDYGFTVKNTGTVELSGLQITDLLPGMDVSGCSWDSLAVDESQTCAGSYTVKAGDLTRGVIHNVATVQAEGPDGAKVSDTDEATVYPVFHPSLEVVKTADVATVTHAGQQVTYTFQVTNNGTTVMTDVTVSDVLPDIVLDGCSWDSLAVGQSETCTGVYTVRVEDMNAGQVANVATVTGKDPNGDPEDGTDEIIIPAVGQPGLSLAKSAEVTDKNGQEKKNVTLVGDQVVYTFAVANTGTMTVDNLRIEDAFSQGDDSRLSEPTCDKTSLDPGQTASCTGTYPVAQTDLDNGVISNTAIATGTDPKGDQVYSDPSGVDVPVNQTGGITVDKTADKTVVAEAGTSVRYTFVVTNTSNVTLIYVGVADPMPGLSLVGCSWDSLAAGASVSCYGTYTVKQSDLDKGSLVNTATASGELPDGSKAEGQDDNEITVQPAAAGISVEKRAGVPDVVRAGQQVPYTFTVKNTGGVTLSDVRVSDPLLGDAVAGCGPWTLAPGASRDCTAMYTVTLDDMNAGSIHNVATATGTPPTGDPVTGEDSVDLPANQSPLLDVDKSTATTSIDHVGQQVTYGFVVTNRGNVTVSDVVVSDPMFGGAITGCGPWTLTPGQQVVCSAVHEVTQPDMDGGRQLANTATVTGVGPDGKPAIPDDDTVTIPVGSDQGALDVTKTASTYLATAVGQQVTFTIAIRNSGPVVLTDVTLSDELDGVDISGCGPWARLAVGQTIRCTAAYTVTQHDMDAGQIVNTVTVDATQPDGDKVSGGDSVLVDVDDAGALRVVKSADTSRITHADQQVTYTFAVTNMGKVTLSDVTLDDSLSGVTLSDCGPWATLAPNASVTCKGTYPVKQADIDAGSVHNVATVTGTKPGGGQVSDESQVTIPNAPNLGGLKVVKATDSLVSAAGQPVNYTFAVTNTGQVVLSHVTLADPMPGLALIGCGWDSLAPQETGRCTGTYVSTTTDVGNGRIVNTATATGTMPDGTTLNGSSTATIVIGGPGQGRVSLVKTAATDGPVRAAGQTITYTFTVSNPSQVAIANVELTDSLPDVTLSGCSWATLAAGSSATCTGTYTVTQADLDRGLVHNLATVTGDSPDGTKVSDQDDVTVYEVFAPSLHIVKSTETEKVTHAGQEIEYSFAVTNDGTTTLHDIGVTDSLPDVTLSGCSWATLLPGDSRTCTGSYTVTLADMNAGRVVNSAVVTGKDPNDDPIDDPGTVVTPADEQPGLSVVKTAQAKDADGNDVEKVSAVGDQVVYTFTVTNTGNVTVHGIGVDDTFTRGDRGRLSEITCDKATLDPEGVAVCTATYTVALADLDAGTIANTAVAKGTGPGEDPVESDGSDMTVTPQQKPGLSIVKTAQAYDAQGDPIDTIGSTDDSVVYTYKVTNTGNVTAYQVSVDDQMTVGDQSRLSDVDYGGQTRTLAPGESQSYMAVYQVVQSDLDGQHVKNVATATAVLPDPDDPGNPGKDVFPDEPSDDQTVDTDQQPGLEVTKTGQALNVDGEPVDEVTSDTDTVQYAFHVVNTGNVTLFGITIDDRVTVGSQARLSDIACPGSDTAGTIATLSPQASVDCTATYDVAQADIDAGRVTNTATASGHTPDPADPTKGGDDTTDSPPTTMTVDAGQTPGLATAKSAQAYGTGGQPVSEVSAAGQRIVYSFEVTNTGNVTMYNVAVNDTVVAGTGELSTIDYGDQSRVLAPGESQTYTATYRVTQDDLDAGLIADTAVATGKLPNPDDPGKPGDKDVPPQPPDQNEIVPVNGPELSVAKTAQVLDKNGSQIDAISAPGDRIIYTFTVTNSGDVTAYNVTVDDKLTVGDPAQLTAPDYQGKSQTIEPGEYQTYTATYTVTQADLDTGQVVNTATVTGQRPDPGNPRRGGPDTFPPSTPDEAVVTATDQPALTLTKKPSLADGAQRIQGDVITYRFTITNSGNVTVTDVSIDDQLPGLSAITYDTWPGAAGTLAPGQQVTATATYTATAADAVAGGVNNTARATGKDPSGKPVPSEPAAAGVPLSASPALTLTKTASTATAKVGDVITYTLTATNTGNVTLNDVQITDTLPGLVMGTPTWPGATGVLNPGQKATVTAMYAVTAADAAAGKVINSATVTGTVPGWTPGGPTPAGVIGSPSPQTGAQTTVTITPGGNDNGGNGNGGNGNGGNVTGGTGNGNGGGTGGNGQRVGTGGSVTMTGSAAWLAAMAVLLGCGAVFTMNTRRRRGQETLGGAEKH